MSWKYLRVCTLLAAATLLTATAAFGQSPIVSRYVDNERWTMADCMARAKWALETEGYRIRWTAGDIHRADKAPYTALILCDPTPEGLVRVNVIIAATGGNLDAENTRLWTRLRNPGTSGAGGGCSPFEGVWTTNYTPITFRRTGNTITGSYEYQGASSLRGTLTGGVLEGEYSQPSYPDPLYRRGRFRFELKSDGQTFTGSWWNANGTSSGEWNGRCQTP